MDKQKEQIRTLHDRELEELRKHFMGERPEPKDKKKEPPKKYGQGGYGR